MTELDASSSCGCPLEPGWDRHRKSGKGIVRESNVGSACLANRKSQIVQIRCILIWGVDLLGFQRLMLNSELQWDRGNMPHIIAI